MNTSYLKRAVGFCLLLLCSLALTAQEGGGLREVASKDSWIMLKTTSANREWKLTASKSESAEAAWIDLNNNGSWDEGETIEDYDGSVSRFAVASTEVKIYGKLTELSMEPVSSQGVGGTKEGNHLVEVAFHNCTTLEKLNLSGNELTKVTLVPEVSIGTVGDDREPQAPNLEDLILRENKLQKLDLTGLNKLWNIDASFNQLTEINLPNFEDDMTSVILRNNKFTELDLSKVPNIWMLSLDDNKLTHIKLGEQDVLEVLSLSGNQLSEIDLSHCTALAELWIAGNLFYSLDLSGMSTLERLECQNNRLTNLKLEGCTKLSRLYAYNNRLLGEVASAIVSQLPAKTEERPGKCYFVDLKLTPADGNRLTIGDVSSLHGKHWEVYDNNNGEPVPYDGNDTPILGPTYSVTLKTVGNGTAELQVADGLDLTKLPQGTVVTVTFTRPEGFWLKSLVAGDEDLKKVNETTGQRYQLVVESDTEIIATFAECPYTTDQPHMTFVTDLTPGGEKKWDFAFYGTYLADDGNSTIWVDFNGNGKFDESEESSNKNGGFNRPVEAQTLTIYGPLKMLIMVDLGLTSIDTKDNPELRTLFVNRNKLTKVDMTANKKLRYLYVDDNKLTEIKFNAPDLVLLSFYTNKLSKDAVADIIQHLPDRNKPLPGYEKPDKGELYVKNLTSKDDENDVHAFWIDVAKSLNWKVYAIDKDPDDPEYTIDVPYGGEHVGIDRIDGEALDIVHCDDHLVVVLPKTLVGHTLALYNVEGVAVHEELTQQQSCTIDVANLPQGVYLLKIADQVYKLYL